MDLAVLRRVLGSHSNRVRWVVLVYEAESEEANSLAESS
jgi:hypothetical protein